MCYGVEIIETLRRPSIWVQISSLPALAFALSEVVRFPATAGVFELPASFAVPCIFLKQSGFWERAEAVVRKLSAPLRTGRFPHVRRRGAEGHLRDLSSRHSWLR